MRCDGQPGKFDIGFCKFLVATYHRSRHNHRLVEEVVINLGWSAEIGNGFPIRAGLLIDLEGKEHPLL